MLIDLNLVHLIVCFIRAPLLLSQYVLIILMQAAIVFELILSQGRLLQRLTWKRYALIDYSKSRHKSLIYFIVFCVNASIPFGSFLVVSVSSCLMYSLAWPPLL